MSSTTGKLFVVSTFGESHGPAVGAVVDGCPAGLSLTVDDLQGQMDRRRPGQSSITTPRNEADTVSILSGVDNGITLGTPITLVVENRSQRPADYSETANIPRPSHADYTYMAKYGKAPPSGGGRSSARETVGRVAAGSVAEKYLSDSHGVEIVAWVSSVGTVDASAVEEGSISRSAVDVNSVRCPDADAASRKCIRLVFCERTQFIQHKNKMINLSKEGSYEKHLSFTNKRGKRKHFRDSLLSRLFKSCIFHTLF